MDETQIDRWLEQVEDVLDRCALSSIDPADAVSDAHALLTDGPDDICGPVEPAIGRASLQALLDAGAFESAALRLLGKCGYMLSRRGDGLVIASVVLPPDGRDYSFSASSEAAALCGALATCLQEKVMTGRRTDQTVLRRRPD